MNIFLLYLKIEIGLFDAVQYVEHSQRNLANQLNSVIYHPIMNGVILRDFYTWYKHCIFHQDQDSNFYALLKRHVYSSFLSMVSRWQTIHLIHLCNHHHQIGHCSIYG